MTQMELAVKIKSHSCETGTVIYECPISKYTIFVDKSGIIVDYRGGSNECHSIYRVCCIVNKNIHSAIRTYDIEKFILFIYYCKTWWIFGHLPSTMTNVPGHLPSTMTNVPRYLPSTMTNVPLEIIKEIADLYLSINMLF